MASWEYNCPKFANLAASSDESISELEKYFEVDHEEDAENRRLTRSATAAIAASGGILDAKVERPARKPPSTPKSKAARRLARQKEQEAIDIYREPPTLSDASTEPQEPVVQESLPICEITGKENRNTDQSEERSNAASTSAVESYKRKTSPKERLLAHHPVDSSLDGSVVATKMEEATLKVSKPTVLSAVKKSGAPLDVKKRIVPLSVRQHAPPLAISKSAVAVPVKEVVTPALRKPAAVPAAQLQSLAELVGKFHSKTPTRFRRVPKDPGGERHGVVFKKPTIPVTPKLATQLRSRTVSLRDQKRKAEEVSVCVSNPKKPKVEAVRANAKVALVSKPALHAKKVEQDLLVSKLSTKPPQKKLANIPTSRDVSKRLTVAKSPAFALKLRSETWKKRKQVEQKASGASASSTETESTAGTIKMKPRRKGTATKGKSGTLKNYTKSKADESISGEKTSQSFSSKNISQEGNSAVNIDKGKTLASAASKEKIGTKGGSGKGKKPLAAAKMTRRASSSRHVIKPHLQGISEKLWHPAKTRRSGKAKLQGPTKMNAQYRPQGKTKDKETVKIANTQSSTGSETEKPTRFKAKPAPDSSRVFRLRSTSAPVTKPKPFRLASVERHKESMLEFQKKKERIEAERLQKTKFVARPVPRSIKERPKSVDQTMVGTTKPCLSEHVSRPRRRQDV